MLALLKAAVKDMQTLKYKCATAFTSASALKKSSTGG